MVLITKKEIYIRIMELESTASQAIKGSLEVRVGGKAADLGTLNPIHDQIGLDNHRRRPITQY